MSRSAQINDLSGSYGSIRHEVIAAKVRAYQLDRLYGTVMVERVVDGVKRMVHDLAALDPATRLFVMAPPPAGLGIGYGIIHAPGWTGANEAQHANDLENDLRALGIPASGQPGAGSPCVVLSNAEDHAWDIVAFLAAWRKLRPARETGWVIEGFQGGRINPTMVAAIKADPNLTVYGESYRGSMYPQAADAVKDDLRGSGLPNTRIRLVYDGRLGAPDGMDGCVFTLESLP